MEARVECLQSVERPRLTVIHDGDGQAGYSALPHAVLTDPRTKHGHIVTYAVLQMYWWQSGECFASNATLRAIVKCSDAQLRRYLKDLVTWQFIAERPRGAGQGKAYSPLSEPSQPLTHERLNRSDMNGSESNRSPVTVQPLTGEQINRSPVSNRRRHSEEDTYGSNTQEVDAAGAAPAPAKASKVERASRIREDAAITERHYEAAQRMGFSAARADAEWLKFSDHHRAKGTRMLDWLAAWRTWLRKAVEFDAQRGAYRNGSRPAASSDVMAPGAASKQKSSWNDPAAVAKWGRIRTLGGPRDE